MGINQPHSRLTPREIEILKLIALGNSTKKIAAILGISFKTVYCHRWRMMNKLGVHDVASLTRYAVQYGYVDVGKTPRF